MPSGVYKRTVENKRNMSKARKKMWQDSKFREKQSKSAIERYRNPEYRKKFSRIMTRVMNKPEVKEKISKALKGKPKSKEHIRKNSESHIGKHLSEETKRKIGEGNKGKLVTEETKKKMSKALRGRVFTEEWKRKIGSGNKGKVITEECKKKMSKALRREKNPMWNGGISFEPYSTDWTETLRRSIRERDHYICQLCSNYGNTVHHIDYDKKNCNPKNLITLCHSCNLKVNTNREYWTEYFKSILERRKEWGSDTMIQPKKYGINCTY